MIFDGFLIGKVISGPTFGEEWEPIFVSGLPKGIRPLSIGNDAIAESSYYISSFADDAAAAAAATAVTQMEREKPVWHPDG